MEELNTAAVGDNYMARHFASYQSRNKLSLSVYKENSEYCKPLILAYSGYVMGGLGRRSLQCDVPG